MPKIVARRLEKVQRDFLWGGGNMEGKIHLVKWEVVCTDKEKGGLGLRKLAMLNKALLGKWIWRYACDKDNLWKQVIKVKYGQEGLGWRPKKANGAVGVGVWKEIWKESNWCWDNMIFRVGKGNKIKFWIDVWCTDTTLSHCFPHLFGMAVQRSSTIEEMWDQNSGRGGWNLNFLRDFNDWELDMVGDLLHMLRGHRPSLEEDSVFWRQGRNGQFRVKEAYSLLTNSNDTGFPSRSIWVGRVPTKVVFFAWEATWGKVLTLDRLQRRGVQLPNCCFLCGCEEENVNHILIHCIVVRALWDIVLGLVDVKWVFPETVKEVQSVGYDILCGPLLVVQIILGSASVARRKILAEMGYEFTVMTADIDEKGIRKEKPEELVMAIAEAKADAIISKLQTIDNREKDTKPTILVAADTAEAILPKLPVGHYKMDAEPTLLITSDQV
ncbi:putative ribonuclease H protein [Vitis vinifera]|uniref:Putative ribonuclease H protein n=1 Tax=Vitis vinifera TaxID=29760 RepID=A0A438K1L6_VITVI|nr:putative ribonuclease H protein [Vitis vinifera]